MCSLKNPSMLIAKYKNGTCIKLYFGWSINFLMSLDYCFSFDIFTFNTFMQCRWIWLGGCIFSLFILYYLHWKLAKHRISASFSIDKSSRFGILMVRTTATTAINKNTDISAQRNWNFIENCKSARKSCKNLSNCFHLFV